MFAHREAHSPGDLLSKRFAPRGLESHKALQQAKPLQPGPYSLASAALPLRPLQPPNLHSLAFSALTAWHPQPDLHSLVSQGPLRGSPTPELSPRLTHHETRSADTHIGALHSDPASRGADSPPTTVYGPILYPGAYGYPRVGPRLHPGTCKRTGTSPGSSLCPGYSPHM